MKKNVYSTSREQSTLCIHVIFQRLKHAIVQSNSDAPIQGMRDHRMVLLRI